MDSGTIVLTANAALMGATTFQQSAGTTQVDGTLGAMQVTLSGGTLDGTGRVTGALLNSGSLVLAGVQGGPVASLAVGSYVQGPGGTLDTTLAASGQAREVVASGTVSLQGGTLVIYSTTPLAPGQHYTVLQAQAGLSGTFAQLKYGAFVGDGRSVAIGAWLYLVAFYDDAGGTVTLTVSDTPPSVQAVPVVTHGALAFGNVHTGTVVRTTLSVKNAAGAPADALDVSIARVTGGAVAGGVIAALAPQATSTAISAGIDTSSTGVKDGLVTLALTSNSGGGITAPLPNQTIAVTGTAYEEAQAGITIPGATIHVGDSGNFSIGVRNIAGGPGGLISAQAIPAFGNFTEALVATLTGTTGGLIATPGTLRLAPNAAGAFVVTVNTTAASTTSGSALLTLASDGGTGAGSLDGLGLTSLGDRSIAVNITVDNYAHPDFQVTKGGPIAGAVSGNGTAETLDLGIIAHHSGPLTVGLSILNDAAGPTDALAGTLTASGDAAFATTGLGPFLALLGGQADTAPTVTLDTSTDGRFTETLTLASTGSNVSGYSAAIAPRTLIITGQVADLPPPTITAPTKRDTFANVATSIAGIIISDVNADGIFTMTVTDTAGALSANQAGGVIITGQNGQRKLTLTGTLADINASLASLTYVAGAAGWDQINIAVIDGHRASSVTSFAVSTSSISSNIQPLLQFPTKLSLIPGVLTGVPGISVTLPPGGDPTKVYTLTLDNKGSS